MAKTEPKSVEQMNYEEAYAELESIVAALEAGELALDQSIALFERGQLLTSRCSELLEKAELKVRELGGGTLADPGDAS
jgi:exodeoxyribonuclease VII small subunit